MARAGSTYVYCGNKRVASSGTVLLWMAQDPEDLILGVCNSCKFLTPLLHLSFVICFSVKLLQHKPRYSSDPRHHMEAVGNTQGTVVPSSWSPKNARYYTSTSTKQIKKSSAFLTRAKWERGRITAQCKGEIQTCAEKRRANSCLNLHLHLSDPKGLFGNLVRTQHLLS